MPKTLPTILSRFFSVCRWFFTLVFYFLIFVVVVVAFVFGLLCVFGTENVLVFYFVLFFVVFLSLLCVAQAQQQQWKHLCRFLVVSVSVSVFCTCCFYCFNLLRSAICLPRLFVVVVRATEEQQQQRQRQHLNLICSTLKFINSHFILFFIFAFYIPNLH